MKNVIPNDFLQEIDPFEKVYCLISGGVDSTAMVLGISETRTPILLHTNTGLTLESSKKTIEKLKEMTGSEYIELRPTFKNGDSLKTTLIDSFRAIPKVINKRYDRRYIRCCKKLKIEPFINFAKGLSEKDRNSSVFLLGIARYESSVRFLFLEKLKNKDTYTIFSKTRNVYNAYPFRDVNSNQTLLKFCRSSGFKEIKSSGCSICPILIAKNLFRKDPASYSKSRRFMIKHVKELKICTQGDLLDGEWL